MIDLHLHLDGSLTVENIRYLAKLQDAIIVEDDESLQNKLSAPTNCMSLNEYLEKFDLPLQFMQTNKSIGYCVKSLLARLESIGIKYCEIRFAPQLHTRQGLSQEQVVNSAIEGLRQGVNGNIKAGLVLCCMRGNDNRDQNITTIMLADEYRDMGIVGVDLAGAEAIYPTKDYQDIFALAEQKKLNITIHAGEADGEESIFWALKMGAKRIGHGVKLIGKNALMDEIKLRGIGIEMCPTSNLQTKAINSLEFYPLRAYLERGLLVSVNSDNMTVSATTVVDEFELLKQNYQLTLAEEKQLLMNAIEMSFANDDTKKWLKSYL